MSPKPKKEDRDAIKKAIKALIAEHVKRLKSVRDLWTLYRDTWAARHRLEIDDPEIADVFVALEDSFYAGAATVWELVTRVAPDAVSEEQGEQMLQRIQDELDAYTARGSDA